MDPSWFLHGALVASPPAGEGRASVGTHSQGWTTAHSSHPLPWADMAGWKPRKGSEDGASILFPQIAHSFCMFKTSRWISPPQTLAFSPGTYTDILQQGALLCPIASPVCSPQSLPSPFSTVFSELPSVSLRRTSQTDGHWRAVGILKAVDGICAALPLSIQVTESSRLEKTSETIQSAHQPTCTMPTHRFVESLRLEDNSQIPRAAPAHLHRAHCPRPECHLSMVLGHLQRW